MRQHLVRITALIVLVGVGAALYVFIAALGPSEKAKANDPNLMIDLSKIPEGEWRLFEWRGLPVVVLHRTKEQLEQINKLESYRDHKGIQTNVPDPDGLISEYRSIRPEYFVVYGWTGNAIQCGSQYTTKIYFLPEIKGGFSEACRGAWHDVTGRLLKGSWTDGGDLPIPPYEFINNTTIRLEPNNEHILHMWKSKSQAYNTSLQPTSVLTHLLG